MIVAEGASLLRKLWDRREARKESKRWVC